MLSCRMVCICPEDVLCSEGLNFLVCGLDRPVLLWGLHRPVLVCGLHRPVLVCGLHRPVLLCGLHTPVLLCGLHTPLLLCGLHTPDLDGCSSWYCTLVDFLVKQNERTLVDCLGGRMSGLLRVSMETEWLLSDCTACWLLFSYRGGQTKCCTRMR